MSLDSNCTASLITWLEKKFIYFVDCLHDSRSTRGGGEKRSTLPLTAPTVRTTMTYGVAVCSSWQYDLPHQGDFWISFLNWKYRAWKIHFWDVRIWSKMTDHPSVSYYLSNEMEIKKSRRWGKLYCHKLQTATPYATLAQSDEAVGGVLRFLPPPLVAFRSILWAQQITTFEVYSSISSSFQRMRPSVIERLKNHKTCAWTVRPSSKTYEFHDYLCKFIKRDAPNTGMHCIKCNGTIKSQWRVRSGVRFPFEI